MCSLESEQFLQTLQEFQIRYWPIQRGFARTEASMWQKEFINALKSDFRSRREKNPRYSIRSHAKRLGLSLSSLSQILSDKRKWNMKPRLAAALIDKLSLEDYEKKRLLTMMSATLPLPWTEIKTSQFSVLLNWEFSAVCLCHDLPMEQRTPEAISRRLGLSVRRTKSIINDLCQQGFLHKDEKTGVLEKAPKQWTAGDGPSNQVIRDHHRDNLKLSLKGLEEVPSHLRDFSTITFTGSLKQLETLREEIRQFEERIVNLMNGGGNDEQVFRFSTAFFPLQFQSED